MRWRLSEQKYWTLAVAPGAALARSFLLDSAKPSHPAGLFDGPQEALETHAAAGGELRAVEPCRRPTGGRSARGRCPDFGVAFADLVLEPGDELLAPPSESRSRAQWPPAHAPQPNGMLFGALHCNGARGVARVALSANLSTSAG